MYADTPRDAELDRPWPKGSGPFADKRSDGINRLPFNFDYSKHPANFRKIGLDEQQREIIKSSWDPWDRNKLGTRPKSAIEDFPTPPWIYRALCEHILGGKSHLGNLRCLEPACGRMYSSDALWDYFRHVRSSDVGEYGFGARYNFLDAVYTDDSFDWVITNPPFSLWIEFALEALRVASRGVALLGPLNMLCGLERYNQLYRAKPLSMIVGMVERVQIRDEFVVPDSKQPLEYAWFIWSKHPDLNAKKHFQMPPCRELLEKPEDYIYRV